MPKREHLKTSDYKARKSQKRHKKNVTSNKVTYTAQGSLSDYYSNSKQLPTLDLLGEMNSICCSCGAMMWKNETHSGVLNVNSKFSTCCAQGKIQLPFITDPPNLIKRLLSEDSNEAKHFRHHIRAFNSSLAFASLGVKEDILPPKGPYTFRICGSVYHRIGHLLPEIGDKPKFSQIYIYDTDNELSNRLAWNAELDKHILLELQNMLHECNPFVGCFRHAADMFSTSQDSENMKLVLKHDTNKDLRRYNLPSSSELSVIIPGSSSSNSPSNRDIVLYKRASNNPNSNDIMHINETHQYYDPLHYVLIFPFGDTGWTPGIKHKGDGSSQVSVMNFYAYHLMQRQNFNLLLKCGRLFHQYIVDQYAKIEQERLNYCLYHQHELRAELYQGLSDSVHAGDTDGSSVGRKIILPASFIGSARNMNQLYQDAMAIVRRYGKLDLFITVTCNPKWEEIASSLLPGQTPSDRPDIITRVFHQKLKKLLHDITFNNIFGKVIAYVYTIEFQKRGLPHCHILLILDASCRPKSADDYDKYVAAEIPNKQLAPELYQIVSQHMLHGPCGEANKKNPCMENGTCTKQFPKQFQDKTTMSQDGYPIYKRAENGVTIEKKGVRLDNRWIVPYNPYLCAKYSAHINVEICSTVTAVKYLYKYVYKGQDRIMAGVQHGKINEIQRYIDARYVSASEASWRIFHYELHDRSPAVQRLAVHLQGQQTVIYNEGKAEEALDKIKNTTLSAWFEINSECDEARSIPYHLFPEHFTWNTTAGKWKPRKCGNAIGRLYQANPSEGERFYLRLLLHHTPGCTSYEDIRTLPDGTICQTFKETALKRGFLQDDNEWVECLHEAVLTASPSQIRLLFVTILVFCEPSCPDQMWDKFKKHMSEDIIRQNKFYSEPYVFEKALQIIEGLLQHHGKSLKDFPGMPIPTENVTGFQELSKIMTEELTYKREEQWEKASNCEKQMNADQAKVYYKVIESVLTENTEQTLFFVDGPAGTGKTFLYNAILAKIRSEGKIALAVASSGIADELLEGGRTAHSRFKIPIPILPTSTCNISRQSELAKLITQTSLIIWDEASMLHKYVYECIHRTFCDLLRDDKPFGGKVVLLGGDFRQVLPVIRHASQADIIQSNLQRSFLWPHEQPFHLTINMRVHTSLNNKDSNAKRTFERYLLSIGNGSEQVYNDIGIAKIKLPKEICIHPDDRGIDSLIDSVFPDLDKDGFTEQMYSRAILTCRNESVDNINNKVMTRFNSDESKVYLSADTVGDPTQANLYPTEFLNTLTPSGLPPHKLYLKKNAPVILLRNLNPREGLLNGTRLRVLNLGDRVIEAQIITGRKKGNRVFIPRITLTPSDSGLPFDLKRRQFPVRPAFVLSINKSQGQTLDFVGLDLSCDVFTHGQLYVALSRVRSFHSLSVLPNPNSSDGENFFTDNIVYKEVLI